MKSILLLVACLFGSLFTLHAQEPSLSPIIFIYDASGSMWGQMDGKYKMQIAGKVLTEALDRLPPRQPLGFVAYGHRREKDCRDVEFLVGMDNTDKQPLREAIGEIKPLGRTPLAYSATQVIDQLRTSKVRATIILITDGIESCDGDLCEVIRQARAEGIDFKLHIIGFGLKDDETEALRCAAAAGDGQYHDAANAGSLKLGLEEATGATVDEVAYTPPEMPEKNFSAYVIKNGEAIDAWVRAYPLGSNDYAMALRTYADTAYMSLPAGTYNLTFKPLEGSNVAAVTLPEVVIPTDEAIHRTVSFDAGSLNTFVTVNGAPTDATVNIYPAGTNQSTAGGRTYGKTLTKEVDPGTYDVLIRAIKVKGGASEYRLENIVVSAGKVTEISHDFQSGTLSTMVTNNGEPWDATVSIVSSETGAGTAGGRTYGKSVSSEIPPGWYDVTVKAMELKGIATIHTLGQVEVKAGEETSIAHNFESGTLSVGVSHNGSLVDATVGIYEITQNTNIGGGRTYAHASSNPKVTLVNPGTYRVLVKGLGAHKGKQEQFEVTVKAGEEVSRTVEF